MLPLCGFPANSCKSTFHGVGIPAAKRHRARKFGQRGRPAPERVTKRQNAVAERRNMKQRYTANRALQIAQSPSNRMRRRSFMKGLTVAGAGLMLPGAAFAEGDRQGDHRLRISDGDADILRFLAAAEILETDLWQQYTELVDQEGPYRDALETIDDEMPSYISQNTNDEFSHQDFLNALLVKLHRTPVNLERFRTLSSSPVAPVQNKRLTNL